MTADVVRDLGRPDAAIDLTNAFGAAPSRASSRSSRTALATKDVVTGVAWAKTVLFSVFCAHAPEHRWSTRRRAPPPARRARILPSRIRSSIARTRPTPSSASPLAVGAKIWSIVPVGLLSLVLLFRLRASKRTAARVDRARSRRNRVPHRHAGNHVPAQLAELQESALAGHHLRQRRRSASTGRGTRSASTPVHGKSTSTSLSSSSTRRCSHRRSRR